MRSLIGARLADPDDYNRLVNQTDDHRLQAARDTVAEIETHYEEMIKDLRARVMSSHVLRGRARVLADLGPAKAVVADLEAPESLRRCSATHGKISMCAGGHSPQWPAV